MAKVLVIDDQPSVCTALELLFDLHGLAPLVAHSPEEALDLISREDVGVVVQDMNFHRNATSGDEGVELMKAVRKLDPDVPIVVMTAFTSLEMAVRLIKEGASDYIAKPWDDAKFVTTVRNLMRMRELQQENLRLTSQRQRARADLARKHDLCGLVYTSPQMHEVVSLAVKVAPANVAVLITGPNGSGKEKLADIVQANSRRQGKPYVKVNSGALPDTLIDAELFGADAGAFTGATKTRIGRFEEANEGTLFLDEIGNLSPGAQMKLLRVLQTGEFQRLGSNSTRTADVRILSATNVDLSKGIERGTFREDLYFRLNVIELAIAALRDRPDDILPLAEHFLSVGLADDCQKRPQLSDEARHALVSHDWPGNVRELQNRIQRAVLVRQGPTVRPADLGLAVGSSVAPSLPAMEQSGQTMSSRTQSEAERAEVERALLDAGGVISRAAAQLGLSRQALYRRMQRLGIEIEKRLREP